MWLAIPFFSSPNAQIWPRSLNAAIAGDSDNIYLAISEIDSKSGTGLDFINGYAFLPVYSDLVWYMTNHLSRSQRYSSVYDTTNQWVGFATTSYTLTRKWPSTPVPTDAGHEQMFLWLFGVGGALQYLGQLSAVFNI